MHDDPTCLIHRIFLWKRLFSTFSTFQYKLCLLSWTTEASSKKNKQIFAKAHKNLWKSWLRSWIKACGWQSLAIKTVNLDTPRPDPQPWTQKTANFKSFIFCTAIHLCIKYWLAMKCRFYATTKRMSSHGMYSFLCIFCNSSGALHYELLEKG